MVKVLKNKRLYRYSRFDAPQEMYEICELLKIPKYQFNFMGDRGFIVKHLTGEDGRYQIMHRRFGSIAHPKSNINNWDGHDVRNYFHDVYHFENRAEDTEAQYSKVLQEKWLSERDIDIVMAVYYHRILTSSQLTEMGFFTTKTANKMVRRRCRKLADNYILHAFQPAVEQNLGAAENHYMLGEVGAHIVANRLRRAVKDIGWTFKHNEILMHTVYHTIEINNVFLAYRKLSNELKAKVIRDATDTVELDDSLKEVVQVDKTIAEYLITQSVRGSDGQVRFNPDGLMVLSYRKRKVPFFLEIDRNTMELVDFGAKVPRYEAYARSKLWEQSFGVMPPELVCTTDEKRMIELARTVHQKQEIKSIPWLFTTLDKVKADPLGAIWIQASEADKKEYELVSILDAF